MEWLLNLGYFGLFLGSFVAATVVPFSSDVQLVAMLAAGGNVWFCVAVATLGNWLGGLTSYWLGWLGKWEWIEKYMRVRHETLIKHKSKVDRYGAWLALLTWLPFIGDIFAIALGFYRVDFRKSAKDRPGIKLPPVYQPFTESKPRLNTICRPPVNPVPFCGMRSLSAFLKGLKIPTNPLVLRIQNRKRKGHRYTDAPSGETYIEVL